jgi:RHS repeat-associated protein
LNEGITIAGPSIGNAIQGNAIYGNAKLGIDLIAPNDPPSGVTPNDDLLTSGNPNLSIDTPVISTISLNNGIATLTGYVGATQASGASIFANARVEFFLSDNSSTNGSGKRYVGFLTANASGAFVGNIDLNDYITVYVGTETLTATATNATGNTSEFAVNKPILPLFVAVVDQAIATEAGGVNNGTAGTNPTGNVLTNDTGSGNTVIGVAAGLVSNPNGGVGTTLTGAYGSINIASNGQFTYTVNNALSAVQALRNTSTTVSDVFSYTARNSSNATASSQITVVIQGANDTPTIISDGGDSQTNVTTYESTTYVTTVVAADVDANSSITYTITGGADAIKFAITNTGVLSFITAPDFEAPTDVGANNIYNLNVQASDGTLTTTQSIAVLVLNALESVGTDTYGGIYIDDGSDGFTTTGTWTQTGNGWQSDVRTVPAASGSTATWTFTVPAGIYNVSAHWRTQNYGATNAQFNVAGTTVSVDQSVAPNDFYSSGINWKRLANFTSTGTAVNITLSGLAGSVGNLVADAIRLEGVTSTLAPESNETISTASTITFVPGVPASVGNYLGDGSNGEKDVDFYKVNLAASQSIDIQAEALASEFISDRSTLQSRIRVFNATGTQLFTAASSGGVDPSVSFQATTAGFYYIGISSAENASYSPTSLTGRVNNSTFGSYRLHVLAPLVPPTTTYNQTYTVDTVSDVVNTTTMSLRRAINNAQAAGGSNLIVFSPTITQPVLLDSGLPSITGNITIRGAASGALTVISPNPSASSKLLFTVASTGVLRLENMVLQGAYSTTANGSSANVSGQLWLDRSEIRNSQSNLGGAIYAGGTGSIVMVDSTISDSTATRGGGIYLASTSELTAINSTFSQNDASLTGDAISNYGTGAVSLFSSTVARNGLPSTNTSETLQNLTSGRFVLRNSLVVDNRSIADTSGTFISHGFNVIGNARSAVGLLTMSYLRDQVGGQSLAPVLWGAVGQLSHQGGRTRSVMPVATSPAIDRGSSYGRRTTDQRGADRFLDGPDLGSLSDTQKQVDIGATEFGTYFVNVTNDALDTSPTTTDGIVDTDPTATGSQVSLRAAVKELSNLAGWTGVLEQSTLNKMEGIVRFEPTIAEVVLSNSGNNEQNSQTGDLDVWGNIRVLGNDTPTVITANWMVSNSQTGPQYFALNDRAFQVGPNSTLTLEKVKLAGFRSPDGTTLDGGNGGAIFNDGGTVTLKQSEIFYPYLNSSIWSGKNSAVRGGAIYTQNGRVEVFGSKISLNSAVDGGAIYVQSGELLVDQQSTIEDNSAVGRGGAIYANPSTITIDGQSIIRRNLADIAGGSLHLNSGVTTTIQGASQIDSNAGYSQVLASGVATKGLAIYNLGTLTMRGNSTLSNHTIYGESALYNNGTATLDNVVLSNNIDTAGSSVIRNDYAGKLTFSHSTYSNNGGTATNAGGLVNENGWVRIDDVQFQNNTISAANGGLITNRGVNADMAISNSRFDHNHPGIEPGAPVLYNQSGNLKLDGSRIEYTSNTAGFYATSTAIRNLGVHEFIEKSELSVLPIAADIDPNQTEIFVHSYAAIESLPLPVRLLIGDEVVKVTALNRFQTSLTVERTKPVSHPRTSSVKIYIDHVQNRISVGDPVKFAKYNLPFDILIDNEIMTVTKIEGAVLHVIRGRNLTRASEHQYPFQVWAVSGGLSVTNAVFADNHSEVSLYPGGSETIYNFVHPHTPTTILESATFYNNSRFPAEVYAGSGFSDQTTAKIFQNTADVRTFRTRYESLPEFSFSRIPLAPEAMLSDGAWVDDSPSMTIENSIFSGQPSVQSKQPPAVRGSFQSLGGNLADEAEVKTIPTRNQLSTTETKVRIETPSLLFPPLPFLAQVGHINGRNWDREYVLVTGITEMRDPVSGDKENITELTVQRGVNGTTVQLHPSDSLFAWSTNGFWKATDKFGLPAYEAFSRERVSLTSSITPSTNILQIDDASRFPPVPFNAQIVAPPSYNSDGSLVTTPTTENVTVTQVSGYQVTVARPPSTTNSFASGSALFFSWAVNTRIDPRITRYVPVGSSESIVMPLADSPALDSGITTGFSGQNSVIDSNLAANQYVINKRIVMSVATTFESTTEGYAFFNDTEIAVASTANLPTLPFVASVDGELMDVTAVNTTTRKLTVVRARYDTSNSDIRPGTKIAFGKVLSNSGSDTRFYLEDTAGLPLAPFFLLHGTEIVRVDSIDSVSKTITVSRGMLGSSASSHPIRSLFSGGFEGLDSAKLHFQYSGAIDVQLIEAVGIAKIGNAINVADTSIYVPNLPFPLAGMVGGKIRLGTEVMYVRGGTRPDPNADGHFLSVVRGYENTAPVAAAKGTVAELTGFLFSAANSVPATNDPGYLRVADMILPFDGIRAGIATDPIPVSPSHASRLIVAINDKKLEAIGNNSGFDFAAAAKEQTVLDAVYGTDVLAGTATSIQINVEDTTPLPAVPFLLRYGAERMIVTALDHARNNMTVTRAAQGTTQQVQPLGIVPDRGTFVTVSPGFQLPSTAPFVAQFGRETLQVHGIDPNHRLLTVSRALWNGTPLEQRSGQPFIWGNDQQSPGFNSSMLVLTASISAAATQLIVKGDATIPDLSTLQIRDEKMLATVVTRNNDGTTLVNIVRGILGTVAASHPAESNAILLSDTYGGFRNLNSTIDRGAYEASIWRVNTSADLPDLAPGDGQVTTSSGLVSLRAAIMEANARPGFSSVVVPAGDYSLTSELLISSNVEIQGINAADTYIHANGSRAMRVSSSGRLRIANIKLSGAAGSGVGGGVFVDGGTLVVDRSALTGSSAANGGAISNLNGSVTINNSSLYANSTAGSGGAVHSIGGTVTVSGSTISGNTATVSAGAVYTNSTANLTILSSTIANNSAPIIGGVVADGLNNQFGNALVAKNTSAGQPDLKGIFKSLGSNLIGAPPIAERSLASVMTSNQSSLAIDAAPSVVPALPFVVKIDAELLQVTAIAGTTWTVLRGYNGSTAAAHAANAPIRMDGFWILNDQTGTVASPIDPKLSALSSLTSTSLPVLALQSNSPAINAADAAQGNYLPKVHVNAVSSVMLDFDHPESLPPTPFMIMSASEIRTITSMSGSRGVLNQPFVSLGLSTDVVVLTDGRYAPRLFNSQNTGSTGVASYTPSQLTGLDIGAYEFVPIVTLSASSATSATETNAGTTYYSFLLTRSAVTTGTLDVGYTVEGIGTNPADAEDFVNNKIPFGTVSFASGELTKTVQIAVKDDSILESTEQFRIRLLSPSNVYFPVRQIDATIAPDSDSISFTVSYPATIAEGRGAKYEVTMQGEIEGGIWLLHDVVHGTTNAADFAPQDEVNELIGASFFNGLNGQKRTFAIFSNPDTTNEPNETYSVSFQHSTPALSAYITLPSGVTTSITNDDPVSTPVAKVVVDSVIDLENQPTLQFKVRMEGTISAPVTVQVATNALTGSIPEVSQNFVFTSNTQSFTLSVPITDNNLPGPNRVFEVVPTLISTGGQSIALAPARGGVLDDDTNPTRMAIQACKAVPGAKPGLLDTNSTPYATPANKVFPPKISVTSTTYTIDNTSFLPQYNNYQIGTMAGWTETLVHIEEQQWQVGLSGSLPIKKCGEEDEDSLPPISSELADVVNADWVVPLSQSLTFSPIPSHDYRRDEDVRLEVPGSLSFGTATANTDGTITYVPNTGAALKPELDADGHIIRFTGLEKFSVSYVGITTGKKYETQEIKLAVTNNLPALIGHQRHQVDSNNRMYLPGTIYLEAQEDYYNEKSVRIDLRDIFTDDGTDLTKLKIVDVRDTLFGLDTSNPNATPPTVDPYPNDIRKEVGQFVLGSTTTKRNLIVTKVDQYSIDIRNEVRIADIQSTNGQWTAGTTSPTLWLVVSDGSTKREKETDLQGNVTYKTVEHRWEVEVRFRVQNSYLTNSLWRASSGVPDFESRPWIRTVPELALQTLPVNANSFEVSTFTSADVQYGNMKYLGGDIVVDTFTGDVQTSHSMILDKSGGKAELRLQGLIHDSSLVRDGNANAPIIYAVVARKNSQTALTSLSGKLKLYRNQVEVGYPFSTANVAVTAQSGEKYILAIQPQSLPKDPGLYIWELELTVNSGTTPVVYSIKGEIPILVGDQLEVVSATNPKGLNEEYANPFGAGWMLQGVPSYIFDDRGTTDVEDDRILMHFPGEGTKVFDASPVTLANFGYSGELTPIQVGASGFGIDFPDYQKPPLEFGRFTVSGGEYTYTTADGTQYVAKKSTMHNKPFLLIDRIEQPGVNFVHATTAESQRRGLSFVWNTSDSLPHPVITLARASDSSDTTFFYDADYMIDKIVIGSRIYDITLQEVPTADTTMNRKQLVNIEENNASAGGFVAPGANHQFQYNAAGLLTADKWLDTQTNVLSSVAIEYATGRRMANKVTVGNLDPFWLDNAGTVGFSNTRNRLSQLVTELKQVITSIDKFVGPGSVSSAGTWRKLYQFNQRAQHVGTEEQFAGNKINETQYVYNGLGSVQSEREFVPGANQYRTTFYVYDYQIKQSYKLAANDSIAVDDVTPKYDPTDYRGNVVYTLNAGGHTVNEYETDNERGASVGALVVSKVNAPIEGFDKGKNKNLLEQTTTNYILNDDRRKASMSIDRYLNSDYTESWKYDGKQYLLSHTDTLGLETKYTSYNSRALPEKVQVLDGNDVVESTLTYDPGTGFPTSKITKVGSQTLSTELTTYDLRGFLREEKTISPQGPVLSRTQYEYFADGKLFKSIDGNGIITEHRYNAARNLAGTKVAAGLQYFNRNLGANTGVGQDMEYTYYSDGSLKQTKDLINNRVLSVNYYQHGANLVSSSGSYFGTRSWITTPNVAGAIDASGQPTTNQVDVVMNETDGLGRVHLTDNLLQGGLQKFTYGDIRIDRPTRIESSQAAHASGSQQLITEIRMDNRGNVLYQKIGDAAPQINSYDELNLMYRSDVKATYGQSFYQITGPTGLVLLSTETRRSSAAQPVTAVTANLYDTRGRLVISKDPMFGIEEGVGISTVKYSFENNMLLTLTTDRVGNSSSTRTDALGRVVESISPRKVSTTYQYDIMGNLKQQSSPVDTGVNLTQSWEYDQLNRQRQSTYAGRTSYTDYFDDSLTVVSTDHNDLISRTKTDAQGRLLQVTTPSQLSTSGTAALPKLTTYSYTWNEAGDYRIEESIDTFAVAGSNGQSPNMNHPQLQKWKRKISVAGPVVQSEKAFGTGSYTVDRTVNLDKLGRAESSTTNLRTTTSTFDDSETGIGMSLGVIRTGEANITNAFDSAGNRVQMIKDQERTRTAFDSLSRIASQFVISVNSVSDSIIRTYKGKETSSIDESLATTIRTTNASTGISTVQSSKPYTPEHSISMSSDYLGRTKSRTETGLGTSTYIHDIYSNLLSETDAFGRTQSWIRDAFDRVISHTNFAGQTTTWTYDAWGKVLSQTDPNSLSTSYTYDERSRVLSVTDADGGVTTTVYDVKGWKISLTTPNGQTTSWTYDIYDRVLTETNALTQTKTFGYDAADRKTLVIKPDGNKIQYTYGNGSNPTKEEWLVGTNVIETLNFQYDAVGKMTSASDSATSLEFTYTDGLLSREKQTLAPSIIAQSDYIYAGGQVREVALSLGASATFDSKVSYTYTANGQVATLQQTGPMTDTKSIRYSYDQAGNRVRTERFSDVGYAAPVFETLSSYTNAQNQLKSTVQSIKHQRATGTVLASYDFVWDAGNRLSSVTSSADGLTTYSYTPTNQLSAIDYANAPDQSFTYDLNGNRTGSGNVTGADNRLTSNATWDFLYDANGNMTRRTLKSDNSYIEYTYDHRDRLTDVRYRTSAGTLTKRVHFGYDALNRRYLQTVENGSGTILSTVYYVNQGFRKDHGDAGDEIALRLDGTGSVISRYLHGSLVDEVLAEENIGSGGVRDVLWAMTDHQGSVRDLARVTAGTASVVNHIVYDAFGKTVSETDTAIAHLYGYTGRELDKETGLQYNRARYLDLVLARFISQDPKSFAAGDTNLYRYVGNHPSYATDPSGLVDPQSIGVLNYTEEELRKMGIPQSTIDYLRKQGYMINPTIGDLYRRVGIPTDGTQLCEDGFMESSGNTWVYGTRYTDPNGRSWYETNVFARDGKGGLVNIGSQYWDDYQSMMQAHEDQHILTLAGGMIGTAAGIGASANIGGSLKLPGRPPLSVPAMPPLGSFDDIILNPLSLYGKSADEVAEILGPGWAAGPYGRTGTGWAFRNGDKVVYYHEGGKHVGPYCGVRSGLYNFKVVGPGYKPLPGDKARIIPSVPPKPVGNLK